MLFRSFGLFPVSVLYISISKHFDQLARHRFSVTYIHESPVILSSYYVYLVEFGIQIF